MQPLFLYRARLMGKAECLRMCRLGIATMLGGLGQRCFLALYRFRAVLLTPLVRFGRAELRRECLVSGDVPAVELIFREIDGRVKSLLLTCVVDFLGVDTGFSARRYFG